MALPTRPLAILDACGTTRSIAREVDGNATPPKTLQTLGDSAFGSGARPHAMSEFEGFSAGNDVSVCCYSTFGSQFSCCDCKFGCLRYSPALGASQTYCACFCWKAYTATGGFGDSSCQCVYIRCNGINKMTCYVTRSSPGYTNCFGNTVFGPIDSNDTVCLVSLSRGTFGGNYAYARGVICIYCTFGNVNGSVVKASPCQNETLAVASY